MNVSKVLLAICAFVAALMPLGQALAQAAPCASPSECEEAAAVLAERASGRFAAGDLEAAAVLLREAIQLHETPALHHNLARTLAELGHWDEARSEYQACLRLDPSDAARERIETELGRLDELIRAAQVEVEVEPTAAEVVVAPAPRDSPTTPELDVAPWVLAGSGVVVLGAAIALAFVFQDTVDQIRSAPSLVDALPLRSQAEGLAVAADLSFAVGGTLALIGVVWGVVSLATRGSPDALSLRPRFDGLTTTVRI